MGWIKEDRDYMQNYYGGYCSKVRELYINPIPYYLFCDIVKKIDSNKSKKEKMKILIERTKQT